jgi:hypothetical protein
MSIALVRRSQRLSQPRPHLLLQFLILEISEGRLKLTLTPTHHLLHLLLEMPKGRLKLTPRRTIHHLRLLLEMHQWRLKLTPRRAK